MVTCLLGWPAARVQHITKLTNPLVRGIASWGWLAAGACPTCCPLPTKRVSVRGSVRPSIRPTIHLYFRPFNLPDCLLPTRLHLSPRCGLAGRVPAGRASETASKAAAQPVSVKGAAWTDKGLFLFVFLCFVFRCPHYSTAIT